VTELHDVPDDDVIAHDRNDGCVCGPLLRLVRHPSGAVKWAYVHPSLDGREVEKTPPAP
jgi:hypothetical protein